MDNDRLTANRHLPSVTSSQQSSTHSPAKVSRQFSVEVNMHFMHVLQLVSNVASTIFLVLLPFRIWNLRRGSSKLLPGQHGYAKIVRNIRRNEW